MSKKTFLFLNATFDMPIDSLQKYRNYELMLRYPVLVDVDINRDKMQYEIYDTLMS